MCFPSPRTQEPHYNTKSHVHKFTDLGPGVGINSHDVKFRLAEIILLGDLYYLM